MTPDEFTECLPPFANDPVRSKPPFAFKNLSLRVFPLRANLDALQQLCNGYLHIVPPEVGRFRAVIPYAYLSLLDYGEISEMAKETSIGWFAQTEVYFGVNVEWYQLVNGRWVFRDWAVITPFIFVDDDFSVPLGRMVFGFPKTLAQVKKARSDWLRDSFAPVTLARIEMPVFPELYKGKPLKSRVFLTVERDAPMSNFRIPVDAMSPMAPWVIAAKLAQGMAGFGRDAMRMAQSMRIFEPNPGSNPAFGAAMLNRLAPALAPGGSGFTLNSLNLKQFRSSSNPERISYQALTNGPMQVTAFNGAGPLGEERMALGDLTGGYTVKLYDYASLPIARMLGLDVDCQWRGEGVDVLTLKPVMPFWANLDVTYLKGTNLAWRTDDGVWYGGSGERLAGPCSGDDPGRPGGHPRNPRTQYARPKTPIEESNWPFFNTTATSAVDDAIAGPFEFKGTVIRVLPLLADRERLQNFLDEAINDALPHSESNTPFKFTVWSRPKGYAYVYLTAATLGTVTSGTNNVGDWAKYALSFLIPVKRERQKDREWEVEATGLVPACIFVDTTVAAVSRTEVLGIPTIRAEFVRPPTVWLQEGQDDLEAKQTLLRVDTEVFTALHQGQQAAMNPLIEISSHDFAGIGEPNSLANPSEWAKILKSELAKKYATKREHSYEFQVANALAIELLGGPGLIPADQSPADQSPADQFHRRVPVSFYTLKQFRDVADPGKACYQALMRAPVVFDEIFDIQEIRQTLRVRIHDFPSLNLVERLGIVAKTVHEEGAGVVYGTQAIRPFYIRANVHELHAVRLCWRAGASEWTDETPRHPEKPPIEVDLQAALALDDGDPTEMKSVMGQSLYRRRHGGRDKPSVDSFLKAEKAERATTEKQSKVASTTATAAAAQEPIPDQSQLNEDVEKVQETARRHCRDQFNDLRLLNLSDREGERVEKKIIELESPKFSEKSLTTKFLDLRADWQRRQRMLSPEAQLALETIDPQMVIEAMLSRERANRDVDALWRKRKRELRAEIDAMGGDIPFAHLNPDQGLQAEGARTAHSLAGELENAADAFAQIEQAFYENVLDRQDTRLSWCLTREHINPMLDAMKIFTPLRLKLKFYRDILSTWKIAVPLRHDWVDSEEKRELVKKAAVNLIGVMEDIARKDIVGEPSKDHPGVYAISTRLEELLTELKGEDLALVIRSAPGWRIDAVLKAAELADKYCEAQREALLNKLAKACQRPDFCVRRDCVDAETRDQYFPISESWDEEWYAGEYDGAKRE